ncbi:MAG: hypothetical protein K8S18_04925 [Desulfobacula sp.]|nr:hypothetical protein [Desulfobacula sp.]
MNDSLLTHLPAIHAAILPVVIGLATAFLFYSYQTTNSSRRDFERIIPELKSNIELTWYFPIDISPYYNDQNEVEWKKVKDRLHEVAILFKKWGTEVEVKTIGDSEKIVYQEGVMPIRRSEVLKAGDEALGLLSYYIRNSPYLRNETFSDPQKTNTENDRLWLDEIQNQHMFLSYIFNGFNESLEALMIEYRKQKIEKHFEDAEKQIQENLGEDYDTYDPERLNRIRKSHYPYIDIPYLSELQKMASFSKWVNNTWLKDGRRYINILSDEENKYKIKEKAQWVLGISFIVFILGIILPFIHNTYACSPLVKSFEIGILVLTISPYLFGLCYLASIVFSMKQP